MVKREGFPKTPGQQKPTSLKNTQLNIQIKLKAEKKPSNYKHSFSFLLANQMLQRQQRELQHQPLLIGSSLEIKVTVN